MRGPLKMLIETTKKGYSIQFDCNENEELLVTVSKCRLDEKSEIKRSFSTFALAALKYPEDSITYRIEKMVGELEKQINSQNASTNEGENGKQS